jgi:hypothetical protein
MLGGIQYNVTSRGLETGDILHILKKSSDEELCNCGNCSNVFVSDSDDSVFSVINSKKEETEVKILGDTRRVRPRFKEQRS